MIPAFPQYRKRPTTTRAGVGRSVRGIRSRSNRIRVKTSTGIRDVSYNILNRPTSFVRTNADGTQTKITAAYDTHGRRVWKKVEEISADGTTATVTSHRLFLYRGYLQIASLDLTRPTLPAEHFILWDPTQPVATRPLAIQKNGTWYTYGRDLTKNICELFGSDGYIKTAYTYTPYGSVTASGSVGQPIQWSSEYNDTELGLVYYNYRHYNPADGRWTQFDAMEFMDFYKLSGNNAIQTADYLGLWKKDPKNKNIRIAEKEDTLGGLAHETSGTILDWPCLWPAEDTKNHGYPDRIMPCDKYDISNLVATEGKSVAYYLDKELSQYAMIFPSAIYVNPKDVPENLKKISGEGATPISRFISAGHGGCGGYIDGKWTSYNVQGIVDKAVKEPTFGQAKKRRGPIRCWFTRNATARFSGCSTSQSIAREFAKRVLRKGAKAYGTNQTIGTSYRDGEAMVFYNYKVLSEGKCKWDATAEYFSSRAQNEVWNIHNGSL